MRRSLSTLVFGAALLLGCSADAVSEPEPKLETPGAFVAISGDPQGYQLFRTLSALHLENGQDVIFFTSYAARARDFDEATRLAQEPELQVENTLAVSSRLTLEDYSWKVVWFRTLTEAELSVIR